MTFNSIHSKAENKNQIFLNPSTFTIILGQVRLSSSLFHDHFNCTIRLLLYCSKEYSLGTITRMITQKIMIIIDKLFSRMKCSLNSSLTKSREPWIESPFSYITLDMPLLFHLNLNDFWLVHRTGEDKTRISSRQSPFAISLVSFHLSFIPYHHFDCAISRTFFPLFYDYHLERWGFLWRNFISCLIVIEWWRRRGGGKQHVL